MPMEYGILPTADPHPLVKTLRLLELVTNKLALPDERLKGFSR